MYRWLWAGVISLVLVLAACSSSHKALLGAGDGGVRLRGSPDSGDSAGEGGSGDSAGEGGSGGFAIDGGRSDGAGGFFVPPPPPPIGVCGNNIIEEGEQCDGVDLGGERCVTLGYGEGLLTCHPRTCMYDTSMCSRGRESRCGNNVIEDGEQCDGVDLGGERCVTLGYGEGLLTCDPDTCTYDTDLCDRGREPFCGNNIVEDGEQCDGIDLGGERCVTLGYGEGLLTCDPRTCTYDTSMCDRQREWVCGNNIRDPNEQCDGVDLVHETCMSLGFYAGTLLCDPATCTYNTVMCEQSGWDCGDGVIGGDEECDGADLGGASCESLGFDGGELACDEACLFDTRMCEACGNGRIDAGEACDGRRLAGQSCRSLGYVGGLLACDVSTCEFDVSSCAVCGDGLVQVGENCDGTNLLEQTCDSLGLGSGTLSCDPSVCLFDTSQCDASSGPLCGNGVAERGEECDGDDLLDTSCASLGFDEGTLHCNAATCRFNTSGCVFEDPPPDTACAECTEEHCGEAIAGCQNDSLCMDGIDCIPDRCGPDADVMCALDCFDGNMTTAQRAVAVFSCVFSNCGAFCIAPL